MKTLIIEDETALRNNLAKGLRLKGLSVDCAEDGEIGLAKAINDDYDLIVLDLNLPKLSGMDVLETINQEKPKTKILILSANSDIDTKLNGFNLGAHDYMVKPFHFEELVMRIRVLLHREFVQQPTVLTIDTLTFDTISRDVTVKTAPLNLTSKEMGLLEYFLLNKNRLISQQELIEHVWDESVDIFSNSIRVHMSSLRKKLKNEMGYDPIQTKIGEGYILYEKN